MFGLSFLFSAALWLLPLAGLPILLHLLFRRKSPIIHFSTLRFIKSSLQRTAARKRIQRWLLLATRALLLALLIWAISQPAKKLAANWGAGQGSLGGVAAIVVDTGYSMELKEQEVTLLQRANNLVEDLLRGELKDSKVAIFRSLPNPTDKPEQLETASAILSQWTPLSPQPAPQPLSERVMAAMQLLKRQDATHKWLVVITDLQSKEFAHPVPLMDEGQLLLFDLHPDVPRDAGVTEVAVEPEQTIPGLASEGIVEVTGRSGDSRAVTLSLTAPDGKQLSASPPRMANFDAVGHGQVRFPVELPAERWLLMTGALQVDDSLAWDNTRSHLLEVPPRQVVTLFDAPSQPQAERFLRLALDFSEGKMPAWPIDLRKGRSFDGSINVAVVPVTQWPDENECASLRNFARAGGTIIFALQPGLEESWPKLTATQKKTLADLLPSEVGTESISGAYHATVGVANDPLLAGLTDDKFRLTSIIARRLVPLSSGGQGVTTIL
ncbi:MAG TPA: BatA domain-containing protein, partial [Tepidisphaeraceae bacterium]